MRLLLLFALLVAGPGSARAQAPRRAPVRPVVAPPSDSALRVAAALAVAARIDSARVARDSAAAGRALCTDVLTIPSRGRPLTRDTLLAWIARGAVAYAFAPASEGAVLILSPDDSTVFLTGRSVRTPPDLQPGAPARLWVTREFRRRPAGWCQWRSRVRL